MEWQPIETAPKDGTVVLVWDGDEHQTAKFCRGEWWNTGEIGNDTGKSMSETGLPTHWMPLPPPPVAQEHIPRPPDSLPGYSS